MNGYGDCLTCKSFSKSAFSCVEKETLGRTVTNSSISIGFKKGQDVYLENNPSKGVYCIQTGKVKIYKKCLERNITIGLACNSDLLGLGSMFNNCVYTNSAKCLEDSQICFIPKKTFLGLLTSNQEMMMNMLKQSSLENEKLSNILRDLKCKNTLSRIVCALVHLNEK
ncbi:MAG: Crp/Fnr family transcriptional regulator, partial [Bacteroidia bacterium]